MRRLLILLFLLNAHLSYGKLVVGFGSNVLFLMQSLGVNREIPPPNFLGLNLRIGTLLDEKHLLLVENSHYLRNEGINIAEYKLTYGYILNSKALFGLYPTLGINVDSFKYEDYLLKFKVFHKATEISFSPTIGLGIKLNRYKLSPYLESRYNFGLTGLEVQMGLAVLIGKP